MCEWHTHMYAQFNKKYNDNLLFYVVTRSIVISLEVLTSKAEHMDRVYFSNTLGKYCQGQKGTRDFVLLFSCNMFDKYTLQILVGLYTD